MSEDVVINFGRRKTDHEPGECAGGCEEVKTIDQRLQIQESHIKEIKESLKKNTDETSEILQLMRHGKGFIRISGYIGKFAAWILALAAPVIAIIMTIKSGGKQ